MTNITNLQRPGVINGAVPATYADETALFLDKFAGEVLTAFKETNVMEGRHIVRTIENGRSAQFPATWKTDAQYHVPGTPLLGNNTVKHNQRTINIDAMLESDVFIPNIDEAKAHYDVRSIYSTEIGRALARKFDRTVMQVAVLAARASATVDGGYGGASVVHTNAATDGEVLAAAIFAANQNFDEKDVPDMDRYALLKPAQYYLAAQTTKLINKDWGGVGSYADGTIYRIAGVELVKSNNVPNSNVAAVTGQNNTYSGDFTNTVALVTHKSAVGTVKLMDLTVQKTADDGDFAVMYQGVLLVGKYAMG